MKQFNKEIEEISLSLTAELMAQDHLLVLLVCYEVAWKRHERLAEARPVVDDELAASVLKLHDRIVERLLTDQVEDLLNSIGSAVNGTFSHDMLACRLMLLPMGFLANFVTVEGRAALAAAQRSRLLAGRAKLLLG